MTTVERRSQTNPEEQEETQIIDWGWYGNQLHFSDDPNTFMNGVVLTDEELAERAQKERVKKRHNIVLYLAGKAAEKDEAKLKEAHDAGSLEEHLKGFLPEGIEWEDEMTEIAPVIVDQVLKQRMAVRRQQEKLGKVKEKALVKGAVAKVFAAGEEALLEDPAKKVETVQGALPMAVNWTEGMEEVLDEAIAEVRGVIAEKVKENDPEEVEAAKQELLEDTKKFGDEAAGVIELIEAGKEGEARQAMAQLEQRVKDKEAEAGKNAPHIPDGAAIFGGSS